MFSRRLNEQIAERNSFALEAIRDTIDEQLLFVETLSAQLAVNKNVQQIAEEVSAPLDAAGKHELYNFVKNFNVLLGLSGYSDRTYIYFKHLDIIAKSTSALPTESFYNAYLQGGDMSSEAWREFVGATHEGEYFVLDFFGRSDEIFYIKTVSIYPENTTINVIFRLDKESLASQVSKLYLLGDGQLNILDTAGKDILQIGDVAGSARQKPVKERSLLSYEAHSQVNGWKYVYRLPKKIVYQDINRSKIIILCTLFGSVLISVCVAVSSYRFNRTRFDEILGVFSGDRGTMNEYQFLKEKIELSLRENRHLSDIVDSRNSWMQNSLLSDLLAGRSAVNEGSVKELEKMGLQSEEDTFLVALYYVEQEKADDGSPCEFVINNILDDLLTGRSYLHYAVNYENCVAYIIRAAEDKVRENVFDALVFTYNFIAENFGFKFYAALGELHKKPSGIAISYSEARQTLEYCLSAKEAVVEDYHNVKEKLLQNAYYSQKLEEQLVNLIKVNDKAKLRLMLEDIFIKNLEGGYFSLTAARALTINLFDTVKHFLLRYGIAAEQVFSEEYAALNESFKQGSIERMKEIIFAIYEACCDKILLKLNIKEELSDKIIAYILENYTDQELCIQKLADHFSLSRDYIARKFSEKMHIRLNDYINLVRIDEAKVLLDETNCLISDIAGQVGFSNYRTFVRIFTNVTGISPKQYRNINKH